MKLINVDRRRLVFEVEARDEIELIGKGVHERFVIDRNKFDEKMMNKVANGKKEAGPGSAP